jgi:hypothetical protein
MREKELDTVVPVDDSGVRDSCRADELGSGECEVSLECRQEVRLGESGGPELRQHEDQREGVCERIGNHDDGGGQSFTGED